VVAAENGERFFFVPRSPFSVPLSPLGGAGGRWCDWARSARAFNFIFHDYFISLRQSALRFNIKGNNYRLDKFAGNMDTITKEQYEFANAKIEELLPLVDDNTPANDIRAVELSLMSDIVIAYEEEHFPIEKPSVSKVIALSLEEKGMTQKELAGSIGVSRSRINDYISGRSEPTLKVARLLCRELNIPPAAMLQV
jgi:HTH-type transcriptional regulator/antitoxin HigA